MSILPPLGDAKNETPARMTDIAFNNMQTQEGAISPVISPWPGVTH